ncbi:MAG: lipopolysaccharide kinase InaA family protein [Candidatus Hydrogenedens sp.]
MKYSKKSKYHIWSNEDNFDPDVFLTEIFNTGKVLKETDKTSSLQWYSYFVKKTNYSLSEGIFRHLFLSSRCRSAWNISNYLIDNHIPTPKPVAYLELLKYSLPYQHFFISEYLRGSYNIEVFIRDGIYLSKGITLEYFFEIMKRFLILLWDKGVYHKDLSGKNLLTMEGEPIYLIDLDATYLINHFAIKYKIRNLTQIFDSFCDFVNEKILKDFIFTMLDDLSLKEIKIIYTKIQQLQKQRRNQHLRNIQRYNKKDNLS